MNVKNPKKKSVRGRGRPTNEESRQLDELLVNRALELFLERGYDGVSMEAIADSVGISKRTLYLRYEDKSKLFVEALRWSMKEWFSFPHPVKPGQDFESALYLAAEALLKQSLTPRYIRLGRVAAAQAEAFPHEVGKNYNMSFSPRVEVISELLLAYADELDEACLENTKVTAELFVGLISGVPARLASFGTIRSEEFEKERIKLAVEIFLKGVRKAP